MTVTRTIELKLGPDELAELFCELTGDRQALFFANIHDIAKDWPGAGWCMQSCDIARNIDRDGREVITKLAEHVLCYDELQAALWAALSAANELGLSSSVFPRVEIEAALDKASPASVAESEAPNV